MCCPCARASPYRLDFDALEIVQLISEQTPAVALAIIVLWFYNRLTLDYLRERKDFLETLRTERREWLDGERQRNQQLLDAYRAAIEAIAAMRAEMHALRNKVQEFMTGGKAAGGND